MLIRIILLFFLILITNNSLFGAEIIPLSNSNSGFILTDTTGNVVEMLTFVESPLPPLNKGGIKGGIQDYQQIYNTTLTDTTRGTFDFGKINIGFVSKKNLKIVNLKEDNLVLTNYRVITNDSPEIAFALNISAEVVIPPRDSVELILSFSPKKIFVYDDTLEIKVASGSNLYYLLKGEGVELRFTPNDTINFGDRNIGTTSTINFAIKNISSDILDTLTVSLSCICNGDFVIPTFSSNYKISSKDSVRFSISFSPTDTNFSRIYQDTILVQSETTTNFKLLYNILIMGKGVDRHISSNADTLNFGSVIVGKETLRRIKLTNRGRGEITVSKIIATDQSFYPLENKVFKIAPNDTQEVTIAFSPHDSIFYNDTLFVMNNDPDNSMLPILLKGKGIPIIYSSRWTLPFQCNNDVISIASVDLNGDGFADVVAEAFDADAGTQNDHLYAINGVDGSLLWKAGAGTTGGFGEQCLSIGDVNQDNDPEIILATAWGEGKVYVFDKNGQKRWEYPERGSFSSLDGRSAWAYSTAIAYDYNYSPPKATILITTGNYDNKVYSLKVPDNNQNGALEYIWSYSPKRAVESVITTDLTGDKLEDVIIGVERGGTTPGIATVYCLKNSYSSLPDTSRILWRYNTTESVWTLALIKSDDDTLKDIVAGSWDGYIHCLKGSPDTTKVLFKSSIGSQKIITSVKSIKDVNSDGKDDIIIASWNKYVLCMSGKDGKILWKFPTLNKVWSVNSIVDINADSVQDVIAGSLDNKLYCIDGNRGIGFWAYNTGSPPLAVSTISNYPYILAGTLKDEKSGGNVYSLRTYIQGTFVPIEIYANVIDGKVLIYWTISSLNYKGFNVYRKKAVISNQLSDRLPITNYQLPITDYRLPITNYQLPTTDLQDWQIINSALHPTKEFMKIQSYMETDGYEKINKDLIEGENFIDTDVVYGETYYYKISYINERNEEIFYEPLSVSVNYEPKVNKFELMQNYPNPFSSETVICYVLEGDDGRRARDESFVPRPLSPVTLKIYNINGQLVRTLVNEKQSAGYYSVKWDGKDERNKNVPSGIYFYTLQIKDQYKATRRMVILR